MKTHKKEYIYEMSSPGFSFYGALCNGKYAQEYSTEWADVTCKLCLKAGGR